MADTFKLSQDNIELDFATNHLGHFLLTILFLETMKRTSRESNREGRIVNVSSMCHQDSCREGIRFDSINDKSRYGKYMAYIESKLANILHANELTRRLNKLGVEKTANSLHPGTIRTNIIRNHICVQCFLKVLGLLSMTKTIQQGAATTSFLALHPQVKGISGEYFMEYGDLKVLRPKLALLTGDGLTLPNRALRPRMQIKRLLDFSLSLTNLKE
ncbi:hypothetical protein M0R45_024373 [Rubus argutus]|uniref:Short-chain dehydrogenase TIC 32, chloroplastic n=1 Tax=Rubus argutus TaxID=59490 RepID=A0AAW1WQS3_RUBAR